MSSATLRISPADHGLQMSLDDFEAAEFEEGYRYELGRGVLDVSDVPLPKHAMVWSAINKQLMGYWLTHPDLIHVIVGGGQCRLRIDATQSARHPDLTVYLTAPPSEGNEVWGLWVPELVVEVVSPSSVQRDYQEKREEYLAFGVEEYWIVDPKQAAILVLRRDQERWTERSLGPVDVYETPLLPGFRLACGPVFEAAGGR